MNYYLEMLKKSIERVTADFDFSADIDHNCSKGTFREQIIKDFLRPFLPGEYGIAGGQAFDKLGNISKQLDIVIYDSLHSYIAPYMDDFIYFPCESVYGNIEIKSELNNDSFQKAVENIKSLKMLKRDKIDTYYVNAIKPLEISNINWNIQATNEYFGVVFAYKSVTADAILSYIDNMVKTDKAAFEYLPNVIVLFEDKKIITRYHLRQDGMYEIHPLKEYDGFLVEECENNTLSEFLILLFIMLRSIELKAMDIQEMSKIISQEIFCDKKREVAHLSLRKTNEAKI